MLYPLSYEGGGMTGTMAGTSMKGRCNPPCYEALLARPTGTGYWTRTSVSRVAAIGVTRHAHQLNLKRVWTHGRSCSGAAATATKPACSP